MSKHQQTVSENLLPDNAWQFALLLCAFLVAGCTSRGIFETGDHAPPGMVDISGIQDAVPRPEPLSRYGNPTSYVVYGKRYYTMPSSKGYRQRGIASWYGTKFHGQRTSSGETYDMYKMTAAHKTLPLPSYVEVENLRTGRTIVVKVNDRGPFLHDRIIDLSFVAAAKLGIQEDGTGLVEVRAIETETPLQAARSIPARQKVPPPGSQGRLVHATTGKQALPAGRPVRTAAVVTPPVRTSRPQSRPAQGKTVFLQVGAYRVLKNAEHMVRKVERHYPGSVRIAKINNNKGTFYKVQIGPLGDAAAANRVARDLKPHGINDSHAITR